MFPFFFQAEDGIRDIGVTGVQTCALPISDLTPGLKSFTEEKLARLERILHESPDAHVVLTREKHRHRAEIVVHARIGTLTAKADGAEFEESLGLAIDRLLAQARKHHSKIAKGR